VNFLSIFRKEG